MRTFDYAKLEQVKWDNEILNYTNQIHEFKGKQDLYIRQKSVELDKLVEIAKIQSVESSNRIEGIVTTSTRIQDLVKEKTTPKSRDEYEIAGYRDVLNTIHESYKYIPLESRYILQLHRELMQYAVNKEGGVFKSSQNYIQETRKDGSTFIRFTPAAPYETPSYIDAICESYRLTASQQVVDQLILIPVFITDFLCIHPFSDGNGRMSRLLTLLLLYQAGYNVGKYVSIEKHIEKTKPSYYEALQMASEGWQEGKNDPIPFVKYMLGVILACYREFENRVEVLSKPDESGKAVVKSRATDIVRAAVESRIGKFTKSEILAICPTLSRSSVEAGLRELVTNKEIRRFGKGRGTYYLRSDALH